MTDTIFLIGLRGSGKSTIGRLLAERLSLPFVDADRELEKQAGRTIRDIFATDGESYFRELEERILSEIADGEPKIVATGGGVVLRESNRRTMRSSGRILWLRASVDQLWRRTQLDSNTIDQRPNLVMGGREEVQQLAETRHPLYRECANLIIDTDGRSPSEVVEAILDTWSTSFFATA